MEKFVKIEEDLHRLLKVRASKKGQSIKEYLQLMIVRNLMSEMQIDDREGLQDLTLKYFGPDGVLTKKYYPKEDSKTQTENI